MTARQKYENKGIMLMSVLFIILYGSGFVGSKLGFPYAKPLIFLAVRFALSMILLLIPALIFKSRWPSSWKEVAHLSVSGIFLVALFAIGTWTAIYLGVPPATAALISSLQPLIVAVVLRQISFSGCSR